MGHATRNLNKKSPAASGPTHDKPSPAKPYLTIGKGRGMTLDLHDQRPGHRQQVPTPVCQPTSHPSREVRYVLSEPASSIQTTSVLLHTNEDDRSGAANTASPMERASLRTPFRKLYLHQMRAPQGLLAPQGLPAPLGLPAHWGYLPTGATCPTGVDLPDSLKEALKLPSEVTMAMAEPVRRMCDTQGGQSSVPGSTTHYNRCPQNYRHSGRTDTEKERTL